MRTPAQRFMLCLGLSFLWVGSGCVAPADPEPAAEDVNIPTDDLGADAEETLDPDKDGIPTTEDNCPEMSNVEQADLDEDGQGDTCDPDDDGDGVIDEVDNCPGVTNVGQADTDLDGTGDGCEEDDDDDGVPDGDDVCPLLVDPDQGDTDGDGVGDACSDDDDGDGVLDVMDNCPGVPNLDQLDHDQNSVGSACDDDDDGDGVNDEDDNCPVGYNPDQVDGDADGVGDACDPQADLWLLSVDNDTHELLVVDVQTGAGTPLCTLSVEDKYPSLTFSRDGELFGANNTEDRLDHINPCTCQVTPVGPFDPNGEPTSIVGITTDHATGLFGVDKIYNWVVAVSTETGLATVVGELGIFLGSSGATWSDANQAMWAINGSNHSLHMVDKDTGQATFWTDLDYTFDYVGIELHPANGVIYACTQQMLLSVNPEDGHVTEIGQISENQCNNLAAPYVEVPCLKGVLQ